MKRKLFILVFLLTGGALFLAACRDEEPTPVPDAVPPAPETETSEQAPDGEIVEEPAGPPAEESRTAETLTIPPPVIIEPQAGSVFETGSTVTHQVTQREWLAQIARCYGAPVEAVLAANPSFNQDIILPGSEVKVPEVGTAGPSSGPPCVTIYTVQSGDTWASIAAQAKTSAEILQRANDVPLLVGEKIVVPVSPEPQSGETAEMVTLTHDLIFSAGADMARWNKTTGNVEIFDINSGADVMDLATNANGNPILAKVAFLPSVGGIPSVEMALVNLDTNTVTLNPQGFGAGTVPSLFSNQMIVSEGGTRSAYGFDVIEIDGGDQQNKLANLATFETAAPDIHHFTTAPMRGDPHQLSLFPMDENNLLWSDTNGLWQVPYTLDQESDSFEQLIENDVESDSFVARGYVPEAWAPGSRDALLLLGLDLESVIHNVFDPVGRQLYQVPNSGAFLFSPGVTWLSGSELAVMNLPVTGIPQLSVYTLYQEGRTAGQIEGIFEKSSSPLGEPIQGFTFDEPGQRYSFFAPAVQSQEGKILFAISSNASDDNGLWSVDVATGTVTRLNDFPTLAGQTSWVPDGSGVLVESFADVEGEMTSTVVYVPADGSPLVSLSAWLGMELQDFHWVK